MSQRAMQRVYYDRVAHLYDELLRDHSADQKSHFLTITDAEYQVGLEWLRRDMDTQGADTETTLDFCLITIFGDKPQKDLL